MSDKTEDYNVWELILEEVQRLHVRLDVVGERMERLEQRYKAIEKKIETVLVDLATVHRVQVTAMERISTVERDYVNRPLKSQSSSAGISAEVNHGG
jgi:archaellum component FlaC